MDPDWCLPSKLDKNPMAWMISVDGFILDARCSVKREIQEKAYARGFIPYIPADDKPEDIDGEQTSPHQNKPVNSSPDALYLLDVFLIDGPITIPSPKKEYEEIGLT